MPSVAPAHGSSEILAAFAAAPHAGEAYDEARRTAASRLSAARMVLEAPSDVSVRAAHALASNGAVLRRAFVDATVLAGTPATQSDAATIAAALAAGGAAAIDEAEIDEAIDEADIVEAIDEADIVEANEAGIVEVNDEADIVEAIDEAGIVEVNDEAGIVEAIAIGREVAARVRVAVALDAAWDVEAVADRIGAAISAARVARLDANQIRHALGLAATQAAGLGIAEGTAAGDLARGKAAFDAVEGATLARAGFTSAPASLEGRRGLAALMAHGFDEAALCEGLGQQWISAS